VIAPAMPAVRLSVAQAEKLLVLPRRVGYRRIQQGKLRAFRDSQGILKVSQSEIYRYLSEEG
jgi:hypothetical protein